MACADLEQTAIDDFNSKSFTSSGLPIGILESTDSNNATITETKGVLLCNLLYDATTSPLIRGTADLYLFVKSLTDGSSNSPPTAANDPAIYIKPSYSGPFTRPVLKEIYATSEFPTNVPVFTIATCGPGTQIKGWELDDQQVVKTRDPIRKAFYRTGSQYHPLGQ